jgi:hypothetical protein
MIEKFQTLEVRGRKSSKPWKFFAVLFPMLGSLAFAQGPGSLSQGGFFQAWWGVVSAVDPYEKLFPTAYWYPSADLNNTDRILGIASTNTVNTASVTTNGWQFNGTSQRLDMGRPTEIEVGTNLLYTMAAWVRPATTNFGTVQGIMGKTFAATGDRWALAFATPNVIQQWGIIAEGSTITALTPTVTIQSNIWYHVALSIERGATNGVKLFLDGVQTAQGTFNNTGSITYDGNVNVPFRFGSYNDSSGNPSFFWNGFIDQAAVWNGRALTSNEVFNLFQQTRSGRK